MKKKTPNLVSLGGEAAENKLDEHFDSSEQNLWLLDDCSAQAIKESIDYELKSADNPYVLTNFCRLLSFVF